MFSQFDDQIQQIINDFAGTTQQNKQYFSDNVLSFINKHWKMVCMLSEGMPCINCYCYGNGIDESCLNCQMDYLNMKFPMSYDDYKYMCNKEKYKSYTQFQMECMNMDLMMFNIDLKKNIQNHPINEYQRILNIV